MENVEVEFDIVLLDLRIFEFGVVVVVEDEDVVRELEFSVVEIYEKSVEVVELVSV